MTKLASLPAQPRSSASTPSYPRTVCLALATLSMVGCGGVVAPSADAPSNGSNGGSGNLAGGMVAPFETGGSLATGGSGNLLTATGGEASLSGDVALPFETGGAPSSGGTAAIFPATGGFGNLTGGAPASFETGGTSAVEDAGQAGSNAPDSGGASIDAGPGPTQG